MKSPKHGLLSLLTLVLAASFFVFTPGSASAQGNSQSIPSVLQFGAQPDGKGDNSRAFQEAIRAIAIDKNHGGRLFVPPGRYHFSAPLHISREMVLEGGSGSGRNSGTVLVFDPGVDGLIIDRSSTSDDGGAGDWTVVRDLAVVASAPAGNANGITLHARAKIENVYVRGFGGNGIEIAAWARGNGPNTNANNWSMENVFAEANGGHGIHAKGADANAGVAVGVSAMGNGGWGFLDESFLGNTYIGCHTENNKQGGYSVTNRNARSIFIGSYTESGQPDNHIESPSMVIGGLFGNVQGNAFLAIDGHLSPNWTVRNQKDPKLVTTLGLGGGDVPRGVLSMTASDGSLPYRLEYEKSGTGWWDLNYGEAKNGTAISFSTNKASVDAGQVRFPNGFFVGADSVMRHFTVAAAAPSSGNHSSGEIVFSADPSRTGFIGWVATKSGTPGEWVPFGALMRSQNVSSAPSEGHLQLADWHGSQNEPAVFDGAGTGLLRVHLTSDLAASRVTHLTPGQQLGFLICQDNLGGHSFAWPANVHGGMVVSQEANACSAQTFVADHGEAYATSPGAVNRKVD